MSYISTVHGILDSRHWDFTSLKLFLAQDSSSVNEIDETRLAPLHRVLMDNKCSPEIVKLLIQHGADVNLVPDGGCSPLVTAISRRLDKAVIRELLDGGPDPCKTRESVLCTALFHGNSADVIRMLADAGFPLQGCPSHSSVLHCALEPQQAPLDPDLLGLLLERCPGADLDLPSSYGQSLLCLALGGRQGALLARKLLEAGCSPDACRRHGSLWVCATSYTSRLTLEAVRLVASRCDRLEYANEVGEDPLQLALKYCSYELGAVRFLLELQAQAGTPGRIRSDLGNTALHAATSNCMANPNAVKLLFRFGWGGLVNCVNRSGNTALHTAVACENYKQAIVRMLIKKGASLNLENDNLLTPLSIAAQKGLDSSTLQLLLSNAARIKADSHWDAPSLRWVLTQYDSSGCEDNINCCKLFLKYALLDNPNIYIKDLSLTIWPRAEMTEFANKCAGELNRMKYIIVSPGLTLFEFIWRCFYRESGEEDVFESRLSHSDLIHLLQVLEDNDFPVYVDAVAAHIGRKALKAQLQCTRVHTVVSSNGTPSVRRKITLNNESVRHLVKFLSNDEDLLRLILAFFNRLC